MWRCPPPLAQKRRLPTGEETRGRRAAPTLPGRGRWPPPHPTSGSPLTGTAAGESAGKLGTPHPIPRLVDLALPRLGGGVGGIRGTAGKFRDAARSAGTAAARPLVLGPPPRAQSGSLTQRPRPGAGRDWRGPGGGGARRARPGSRGRPGRPLTCAAGGSCRQRRRGRRAAVATAAAATAATAGAGARTAGAGRRGRAGGRGRARGAQSAPGRAERRRRSKPAPPCFHSRCGAAGRGGAGGGVGGRGRRAAIRPLRLLRLLRAGPPGLHGPQRLCGLRAAISPPR